MAETSLPGPSLPVLRESHRGRSRPESPELPIDHQRRTCEAKDLSSFLIDRFASGRAPLIVTQTSELAETLNRQLHETALQSAPSHAVPFFSPHSIGQVDASCELYAYLRQPKPGISKGRIVPARRIDGDLVLAPDSAMSVSLATWEEPQVVTLVDRSEVEVAAGEPIFTHKHPSVPKSPFSPNECEVRTGSDVAKEVRFWTFGYAAPLSVLPDKGIDAPIVFIDEGKVNSLDEATRLERMMVDSPLPPTIIEMVRSIKPAMSVDHAHAEPDHESRILSSVLDDIPEL